jgi:exodeoxyribonuclease I
MKTLYWHDYETWGASPAQDKPSQFAGVRTDEALNIISEPESFYCRPSSDCLPQPEACLITKITPQKALVEGIAEPEFVARVHELLAEPGTCGVGYNSIRFDDEITRNSLFRNFYDPYEREWRNGNSRWDIIDMVRLTYVLRPENIEWPQKNGLPSFKLELLSDANGIEHSDAHDALSDVHATIAIAKLIRQYQPKLYEYAYSLRDKRQVATLFDLAQRKPLLHISSRFAAIHGGAALVIPLAHHPRNKNSIICYNLAVDPEPLINLSAEQIRERVFSKRNQDEHEEQDERIPLKEIHLNKSPMVITPKMLTSDNAKRLHIDKEQCERHWQQLRDADIADKLATIYQYTHPAKEDPEQQLYDAFINDQDRLLLPAIRGAPPHQLIQFSQRLSDSRLRSLLFRYRARHYPETLTIKEQQQWQQWRYQRLTNPSYGASITLDSYLECLETLGRQEGTDQKILKLLYEYADNLLT